MNPVPDIRVVIPALNEEVSLPLVLAAIPRPLVREVVVVDNGSTDRTAQVAREGGATVLTEGRRGYGSACQKGIAFVAGTPCEILVILDADFSDHPEEMPQLVGPLIENRADLVMGSRTLGVAEPGALLPQQLFGNWLSSALIALFWGHRFTDSGPFRAARMDRFMELGMCDPTFGWNVEMQIKALRNGLRVLEVPVRYRKRHGDRSKITGTLRGSLAAGYKIIGTILYHGLIARRPVSPPP